MPTVAEQVEENVAFLAEVKYRFRRLGRCLKQQYPNYVISMTHGPMVSQGLVCSSQPPPEANGLFAELVAAIKAYRPANYIRVDASTTGSTIPSLTIPLYPPAPIAGTPLPGDTIPNPNPTPPYCWPCQGQIFIA